MFKVKQLNKYFLFISLIANLNTILIASPTTRNNDHLTSCKKKDLTFISYFKDDIEKFFFLTKKKNLYLLELSNWKLQSKLSNDFKKSNTLQKDIYPCVFLGSIGKRYRDIERELSMRPEHRKFNEYHVENNFLIEYICEKEKDKFKSCQRYIVGRIIK
tara:strand:+ start:241 stop:717 length:477 start_codon:yes stop_codon:yes gene_type:complete